MLDTGFPRADAENDFLRARRHQFLAALTNCQRARPVDSGRLVPLDEIVGSLGWRGQRQLGCRQSGSTRSSAPSARGATSTAASGPPLAGSGPAGSG